MNFENHISGLVPLKNQALTKLLKSRVLAFVIGLVTIPAFKISEFWISFYLHPTPIEAKGLGKRFKEVKEIDPSGRDYFYSLEFPGNLDEFHAFAKRLKFPGTLTSSGEYSYTTPDFDQDISISLSDGKIRYVFNGMSATSPTLGNRDSETESSGE